ncbi:DUF4231 domain-containing protein [Solirubrobacter ginsenosidimutans]|uniref:DUF4231 domain-containing protein n=1 Tax=Solirubrobacter ginsenosidimutans TaxID=490573 RepID=A0A9X3S4S6_9ACTN|nr:DUF4231 domain-containing protein [Solirubrobacter ginsenosidimutans]MDA0160918.1 DUF4231 domain-containing protein [Solirubrobacter ginsenosidimutans]
MSVSTGASAVERAWQQQSVWSQVADRLKRDLEGNRRMVLAMTVLGAVLSGGAVVAGLESSLGKGLAALGGAAVALAALARGRAGAATVRDWTRARSVSEALKSEVYVYRAGVGAYAKPDGDRILEERTEMVERDAADLAPRKAGVEPVPRELPPVTDAATYLDERVGGQISGFYRPRAADLQRKLARVRDAQLALSVAGVVAAAVAAFTESDAVAIWVPVLTTVAAAVATHAAAQRYEYLLVEYVRTTDELERLRDRRGSAAAMSDEALIRAAEHVISVQNEGWMAKLTTTA